MSAARTIDVSEVGLRDGLQIERTMIPAEQKIALIDTLSKTGLKKIEITGFAHPKVIPQLADAETVAAGIKREPGVRYAAFVPNARGAERAIKAGIDDLKAGVAVSDSFNRLNVRMTTEEGMKATDEIAAATKGTQSRLVGMIATAFGCPYEGEVSRDRMHRMMDQLLGHDAPIIYLADTTGVANPDRIRRTIEDLNKHFPDATLGLHLHNTRGLGIANALAGLDCGIRHFEGSIGGLGGCPFAPRAVGNICTEDFVHMAHEMGIDTGIDLDALIDAARMAQEMLGRTLPGMVMKSGKASELHAMDAQRVKVD
ncbi:hydroxymethylglutaryl-CoA lyase [Pseudorhodoplanes sinuspersici]|uniref:Hydroxymethylglutaryl-CoA lyase n=1 Tax=Pseudorhodoplanes sinuspersici TaxID=1235591 RepID=A0A1W6ZTB9_9HYPH|nr:hydroxymethylglutaryl-CoA lyase [Pseudorhodoplanes sinuspersici]ARQ00600.1 hydroxymethylglutaryl-CoA lyase [Pseudorhodoplanes sinuspersici]RKE72198.1 hydroxymethylglutaryl-CoA lyase [Pseudorhodoplanes sinuspersici]